MQAATCSKCNRIIAYKGADPDGLICHGPKTESCKYITRLHKQLAAAERRAEVAERVVFHFAGFYYHNTDIREMMDELIDVFDYPDSEEDLLARRYAILEYLAEAELEKGEE